jgi:sugar phosphate isomerase/epimerase
MRLTCSSLSLLGVGPADAITAIAELGFPALDLVSIPSLPEPHVDVVGRDPAELQKLARVAGRAGIEVATVVTIAGDGLNEWDSVEIDARVAWAARACQALGSRRLVLDAGNPIPGEQIDRASALARWKAMFDAAYKLTSAAGIKLVVEAPHSGTLAERFDEVAELLAVLDNPEVGLDYDTSHVHRSGTSLEESLRLVGGRIDKVALRDVDADDEFCRPGRGEVDFAQLFALLAECGYAGDLVIELETPGIEEPDAQRREIELTRAYVEDLLRAR